MTIEQPSQSERKEKGRNVELHILFLRHGEKEYAIETPDTDLTEEGRKMSRDVGATREKRTAVKGYASDTLRTKGTAEGVVAATPTGKKMAQRQSDLLTFHYEPNGEVVRRMLEIRAAIAGSKEEFTTLSPDEQRDRMRRVGVAQADYYLAYGDQRPEPNTYSPVETAAQTAMLIARYTRMGTHMDAGSSVEFVNATHDVNLAAFLKEVLVRDVDGMRVRGFTSIEEIGGPMDYTDHFDVVVKLDEDGKPSMKLSFRGSEYAIDEERLRELVEIARSLKK